MIEAFVGALWALIAYDLIHHFMDYIEYQLELQQHKRYCKKHNLPYIKPADANKALENFMNKPIEEFVEAIRNDEGSELNNYKICPKCLEYKRNFLTEGRSRECMDCAIGNISDN
jgi:hypothetical protein